MADVVKKPGMVIDLGSCTNCQACMISCSNANQTPYWDKKYRTVVEDIIEGTARDFLPRICQQCEDAPCQRVCPTGATYRGADGVVQVNENDCIGCKACIAACPYGARYVFNKEDIHHAEGLYGSLSKHHVPHVDKCDLCAERRAEGKEPACVATCMGKARIYGELADPESKVSKAAHKAMALGVAYGTKPQILYIPKEGKRP